MLMGATRPRQAATRPRHEICFLAKLAGQPALFLISNHRLFADSINSQNFGFS